MVVMRLKPLFASCARAIRTDIELLRSSPSPDTTRAQEQSRTLAVTSISGRSTRESIPSSTLKERTIGSDLRVERPDIDVTASVRDCS